MGDDLNFAQNFTRTAADGLARLAEMPDPRAKTEAQIVINMMTSVQRGAKRLRARSIYVGAQNVLSAMHHEDDVTLTGRIQTLGSLVTSYARGLDELLTETSPVILHPQTVTDKWDTARVTLNALLPTAAPETADMLSRLMRASTPVETATVKPNTQAEIFPFKAKDTTDVTSEVVLEEALEDDITVEPIVTEARIDTPVVIQKPLKNTLQKHVHVDTVRVTLDAMMRDVIADALSVARSIGRTISLSYDMGERSVTETQANNLRIRLSKALSQIIRQALTDDRVGHIDINLAGEQLHIMAGTTAMRVALDPDMAPAQKPLITAETEQGLRNQLDALMDPISFHETAS